MVYSFTFACCKGPHELSESCKSLRSNAFYLELATVNIQFCLATSVAKAPRDMFAVAGLETDVDCTVTGAGLVALPVDEGPHEVFDVGIVVLKQAVDCLLINCCRFISMHHSLGNQA